jgi:hypothetical protein
VCRRSSSATLDLRPVVRRKYRLELLGNADGDDAGFAGPLEIRPDSVDLTVVLVEVEDWDSTFLSERSYRGTEGLAHFAEQNRRGNWLIAVLTEKTSPPGRAPEGQEHTR